MMNPDDVSLLRLPIEDRASLSSTTTVCGELPAMMFLIVAASVMGIISVGYLLLKDKPCGDVDDDSKHDEEVEDVPYAANVRVRCEQKAVCDDLDEELDEERKTERSLCDVEPRASNEPVLSIVISPVDGGCDPFHHDTR